MEIIQVYENIKQLRELKKITREDLASKVEMSVSGYSKLERGDVQDISLLKILKIAEVLEVDLSQVLNFDATQIFNISNGSIQGINNAHIHSDEYKEKYIQKLEEEVTRFKSRDTKK